MSETNNPIKFTPSLDGMQTQNISQNQPVTGMNSDLNVLMEGLAPNEYSFALNANSDALSSNSITSGEMGAINTDMGNIACTDLPLGYNIVGSVYLKGSDNEIALFLYNPSTNYSQIGIIDNNKEYNTIIDTDVCLNFSNEYPIKSISSLYKSIDRILYWTDNNEKPKFINLDNLDGFKNKQGDWICDAFNINRQATSLPVLQLSSVSSYGGNLKLGTYMFFIRYIDYNNHKTDWLSFSNQIPIVDGNLTTGYFNITGNYNAASDLDRYGVDPTNKIINLSISNLLPEEFKYYQLGVLEYINGTGVIANAYILDKRNFTKETEIYSYTGNPTAIEEVTIADEFIIPSVRVEKAASIETIDNRLIFANTSNKQYDWGKFQQAANQIEVEYVIKQIVSDDLNDDSTKNPKHYDTSRSLMRGEVYALGIVYFINEMPSPVFHIPGRVKDLYSAAYGNTNNSSYTSNETNTPAAIDYWDSDIVSGNDTLAFGNNSERWKVYNTAIKTNELAGQTLNGEEIVASGKLGYYETENTYYPDTKDKDGNLIYPNDGINTLKIRHHKMPDTNLEPHSKKVGNLQYIYPLGLNFNNITIPVEYQDVITGYKIVVANKENENDFIVLDKGMMTLPFVTVLRDKSSWFDIFRGGRTILNKGAYISPSIPFTKGNGFDVSIQSDNSYTISKDENFEVVGLDVPLSKFNGTSLNYDYIKLEGYIHNDDLGIYRSSTKDTYLGYVNLIQFDRFKKFDLINPYDNIPLDLNLAVLDSDFINYNTTSLNFNLGYAATQKINGFSGYAQSQLYSKLDESLKNPFYPDNSSTKYILPGNAGDEYAITANKQEIFAFYVSLQNNIVDLHSNLDALLYRSYSQIQPITTNSFCDFNGESFITKWDVRRSIQNPDSSSYIWQMKDLNTNTNLDKRKVGYISTNMSFYVESRINTEYRNIGQYDHESYYSNKGIIVLDPKYQVDANLEVENVENYVLQEDYQVYNQDYSNLNNILTYFPLTDDYDNRYYSNDLKYRIWYSERYINGDTYDNRRKLLANNYTELSIDNADRKGILDVFVYKDNLFAHTESSLFALPTRPQQLQTNENTVFVGQGDFLAIPPKALNTIAYGYAGSSHFTHKQITEQGMVFVDSNRGKVFLFTEGLEEISRNKQKNFFNKNINLFFAKEWDSVLDIYYPYLNAHQSKYFIGYSIYYDKLYYRIFISKRDFTFNKPFKGILDFNNYEQGCIYWNSFDKTFVYINAYNNIETVDFTNKDCFINKSFTVSYNLQSKLWSSFHSFNPNYAFEDNKTFYSWINDSVNNIDNSIWAHGDFINIKNSKLNTLNNRITPSSYYGTLHPHMIEFTIFSGDKNFINERIFNDFEFIMTAYKYDDDSKLDRLVTNKTFNEFYAYNSYQHSGSLNIEVYDKQQNPYGSIKFKPDTVLTEGHHINKWTLNNFRDISLEDVDTDIHTEEWEYKNSYYIGTQGYIDKVPLPSSINYNKNIYKRRKMKDRYLRLRLIHDYNNESDFYSDFYNALRLSTNIVLTNSTNSF